MRETAYLISVGMQWFVLIVGTSFMIALLNKWLLEPVHRPSLLQQIRKHWRWGIVLIVLILCSVPAIFAETEIHRQDAIGNVTVEIIRTPQEQQWAEHTYERPDGARGIYLDSFHNGPGAKAISKEDYEAQVRTLNQRVVDDMNRIDGEALVFTQGGGMSQDDYFKFHSQIEVAKGNIRTQENSIKQSLDQAKPVDIAKSIPGRTIKVVEKKVLVSE